MLKGTFANDVSILGIGRGRGQRPVGLYVRLSRDKGVEIPNIFLSSFTDDAQINRAVINHRV